MSECFPQSAPFPVSFFFFFFFGGGGGGGGGTLQYLNTHLAID